ncbi:MAG: glycerol-3-phosphate responsive antiterminator [Bacillota bacterium]
MAQIWQRIRTLPVIPSVWDDKGLLEATRIPVAVVFLQYGSLFTLPENVQRLKSAHPEAHICFHIDLAAGIAADETGVRWLKEIGVNGIVSTKPSLIEAAKKLGMTAILRVFIQDSRSVRRAVQMSLRCHPDALDALPGPAVPEIMPDLRESLHQPVIAGGLIRHERQVRQLLQAGCRAVGTSSPDLWRLNASFRDETR